MSQPPNGDSSGKRETSDETMRANTIVRFDRQGGEIGRRARLRFAQIRRQNQLYTIPSFTRPASLIMFWFHGGSQTKSTCE